MPEIGPTAIAYALLFVPAGACSSRTRHIYSCGSATSYQVMVHTLRASGILVPGGHTLNSLTLKTIVRNEYQMSKGIREALQDPLKSFGNTPLIAQWLIGHLS